MTERAQRMSVRTRVAILVVVGAGAGGGCRSDDASRVEKGAPVAPAVVESTPAEKAAVARAEEPAPQPLVDGASRNSQLDEGIPGPVSWQPTGADAPIILSIEARPAGASGDMAALLASGATGDPRTVLEFSFNPARSGTVTFLARGEEVLFVQSSIESSGAPRATTANVLRWQPDKKALTVTQSWAGAGDAAPPAWARVP